MGCGWLTLGDPEQWALWEADSALGGSAFQVISSQIATKHLDWACQWPV